LRKVAIIACLAGTSIVFSGCEKENNDNGDDSDKTNNPTEKLVSYICDRSIAVRYYYEYDNLNRLSKVTATEYADFNGDGEDEEGMSWVHIITYPSANTIYYDCGDDKTILTLNNEGKMIKCVNGNRTDMFEYEDEYLKKLTNIRNSIDTSEYNYFWNNGKIDSMVCEYRRYDSKSTFTATYTYSSVPYKECSISPWEFPNFGNVFSSRLLGKNTPYLLSSEIFDDGETINYRYETDAEGYVTKVYRENNKIDGERLYFEVKYK